jgi:hypothetical protein
MTRLLTREEPISFDSYHSITIETNIRKEKAKKGSKSEEISASVITLMFNQGCVGDVCG